MCSVGSCALQIATTGFGYTEDYDNRQSLPRFAPKEVLDQVFRAFAPRKSIPGSLYLARVILSNIGFHSTAAALGVQYGELSGVVLH